MNVDLCVSRPGRIKYVFKYVCKGSDRVPMHFLPQGDTYNEIDQFQDWRYVSASEAVWRLFSFEIVQRHPSVVRLDVHLPDQHTVYFAEGSEQLDAQQSRAGTKLSEWFESNSKYEEARRTMYANYSYYFIWNKSNEAWTPRSMLRVQRPCTRRRDNLEPSTETGSVGRGQPDYNFDRPRADLIGRIYTVSRREGERFYLRTLIVNVPGAVSF